jgi:hypothetical protein
VLFKNRVAARSLRNEPRLMSELIMVASRASSSISIRGFLFTEFRISACQTGANFRLSSAQCILTEIRFSRACKLRPISRVASGIVVRSPAS